MAKAKNATDDGLIKAGETPKMDVALRPDEKIGRTMARVTLDPQTRNANVAMALGSTMFGDRQRPDITESTAILTEEVQRAAKGDLSLATRVYTSQAITLDTLFTELLGRGFNNMGKYPDAADRYIRQALKAQSACRSTLEALARLHQPREQTVKHVHVNEGGQAVVADHFHNHPGGKGSGNEKNDGQSRATRASGTGTALPSANAQRNGVPIASGERQAQVQNARRDEPGGT
jgi:hypothetical protein